MCSALGFLDSGLTGLWGYLMRLTTGTSCLISVKTASSPRHRRSPPIPVNVETSVTVIVGGHVRC